LHLLIHLGLYVNFLGNRTTEFAHHDLSLRHFFSASMYQVLEGSVSLPYSGYSVIKFVRCAILLTTLRCKNTVLARLDGLLNRHVSL
jgi:hypothetical protein